MPNTVFTRHVQAYQGLVPFARTLMPPIADHSQGAVSHCSQVDASLLHLCSKVVRSLDRRDSFPPIVVSDFIFSQSFMCQGMQVEALAKNVGTQHSGPCAVKTANHRVKRLHI